MSISLLYTRGGINLAEGGRGRRGGGEETTASTFPPQLAVLSERKVVSALVLPRLLLFSVNSLSLLCLCHGFFA